MKINLLKNWDRLRTSFWFVPVIMATSSVAMSFVSVALDRTVVQEWANAPEWIYAGGAEGASSVLETIAGSMITVAGVVFSLTLVALSMAASQFGPRLLRNFMRDTMNQIVLGTFVATFLFCLLVLRTIRYDGDGAFVPHLSVTLGVLFAVASLGVLIYFIHHVAVSVQVDEIVTRVSVDLMHGVESLFPEQIGEGTDAGRRRDSLLPDGFGERACAVVAPKDGYLQLVDADALMKFAQESDVVVKIERRPGDYVVAGTVLASAWPGQKIDRELEQRIVSVFVIDQVRTTVQDIEFAVEQLVEIAVRALSPGVNNPFTAISCIDRLGAALCRLAQREMPPPCRHDEQGRLRVMAPASSFAEIADAAFNPIREYARTSTVVTRRLLQTLAIVGQFARRSDDRQAVRRLAESILRGSCALAEENDRRAVEADYRQALEGLQRIQPGVAAAPGEIASRTTTDGVGS
ncbi:MAG TPA: DUF2254 domain-containing protein [Gammaproteobacteria bacterium]